MTAKRKAKSKPRKKKGVKGARRPRPRNGKPITKEGYEDVWRLYSKGESRRTIGNALGYSEPTVRKCIDRGYPKRGMEPLKERLHRVRRQSMQLADRQAVNTRARIFRQAQTQLSNAMMVSILMTNDMDDYRKRNTDRAQDGSIVFTATWDRGEVGKMLGNQEKANSAVKQWKELLDGMQTWSETGGDQEFRDWTTDELEHFAETGELPARVMSQLIGEEVH